MTLWLQELAVKIPEMEGTNPPREKRSPGDHSPEGRAWTARGAARCKHRLGPSRKGVKPQNKTKRGKTTQGTRSNEAPLPPRVREKGLRRGASNLSPPKYRENPKNAKTPGAQNGTPTKRQKERTHGQNGR